MVMGRSKRASGVSLGLRKFDSSQGGVKVARNWFPLM